jgi:hypothetical protein
LGSSNNINQQLSKGRIMSKKLGIGLVMLLSMIIACDLTSAIIANLEKITNSIKFP